MSLFKKPKNHNEDNIGNVAMQPLEASDQLKKISDQLVFLEKKIDQILESTRGQQRRPFGQQRYGGGPGGNYQQRPRGNFRGNSSGNGYGPRPMGHRPHGSHQGGQHNPRPQH